jgi:hypothetical protein
MSRINRTYEEVWDERSFRIDPKKKYKYETPYLKEKDNTIRKTVVKGIYDRTLLSEVYFSPKNIQKVQNKLRYTIWKMSNKQFVIDEQNEDELIIVMRSIFLQYSRNLPTNISEQIEELNNIVVDEISPDVLSQTKQYLRYLEDRNEPYRIMDRPQNVSSAGTKTLEIHTALGFGDPNFKLSEPNSEYKN